MTEEAQRSVKILARLIALAIYDKHKAKTHETKSENGRMDHKDRFANSSDTSFCRTDLGSTSNG